MPLTPAGHHLNIKNIAVARGGRQVIDGLSLDLGAGDILLLAGANGVGKTTLLRHLAGLLPPANASLSCHFIGTRNGLKAHLTVDENLRFWQRLWNGAENTIGKALTHFSLQTLADMPARLLSSGQRQRLALARLMLVPRPVWLLDEAFTALDTEGREALTAIIQEHARTGGSAIIATHDVEALQAVFKDAHILKLEAR